MSAVFSRMSAHPLRNNWVVEMAGTPNPEFVSVDEYLAAEERALTRNEYIDGWVRAMAGAGVRHNLVTLNCVFHLQRLLRGQNCKPFLSDMKLRIRRDGGTRFYYPDLQVVCDSNPQTAVFQDAPVMVVEVLSSSTRQYDLDEKMQAYLQITTLACYLVLEQHQPVAIVLRRTAGGFLRECVDGVHARIELPFPGCTLSMSELYEGIEFTPTCVQEPEVEYETNA
jgi:Uma2 family endonuclease